MKHLNKSAILKLLVLTHFLILHPSASFAQIYVSPNGNDQNTGTVDKPIASFKKAQQMACKSGQQKDILIIFKPGTYYLPETVVFNSKDNTKYKVVYKAEKEGTAVISGGEPLKLNWKPYKKNIFVADLSLPYPVDQLFVNGVRQRMARFPNAKAGKSVYDSWDLSHTVSKDTLTDALLPSRVSKWSNPSGAYLHTMHQFLWGDMHWLITGKTKDSLQMTGGWQNNRPSMMHPVYRMIENVFEELDAPGEWYYNAQLHQLFCFPENGIDLNKANIEIVKLKHLVELNGSENLPVKNIHFKGLVFTHAARTFMENREPLQRSDWTVYRGGALFFNGAENCSVNDCEFKYIGGNAIFVNKYNRNITIRGCYLHHIGASGILFVGDSSAVRSPLYGYVRRDYSKMDTIKGPRNNNYPSKCLIEDCLITLTGRDEKQTAGIHISVSSNIRINHCSIYDMPRAGININEGTFGGHIIENSDIFNTVLETGDHGSFNSWGRDRYWTGDGKSVASEMKLHPDWYLLDIIAPNIIRHNRWRCDFGWDIDLDDGSSHYRIYNNVLLSRGLKLREGYDRIVTNNIILNNSLHPHVWFPNSGDVFKHNIVFAAYKPAIMNKDIPENGKWGAAIDSNLFVCDSLQMHRFLKNGCDSNSVTGNPLFENLSTGDFRVKEGSPALAMGFKNFSTQDFGVVKAELKAIAKQPKMDEIKFVNEKKSTPKIRTIRWMKALLVEPKGEDFSAYGIGFNEGGVAFVELNDDSDLFQSGFRKGDIIQAVNGNAIKGIVDFNLILEKLADQTHHFIFDLVRNQNKKSINYNGKIEKLTDK